jgi:hypothetical protein
MFDFLNPALASLDPSDRAILKAISGEVVKFQVMDEVYNRVGGHEGLAKESERLNIMLKRKQLGMPINDDDYERMNDNDSSKLQVALAKHGIERSRYPIGRVADSVVARHPPIKLDLGPDQGMVEKMMNIFKQQAEGQGGRSVGDDALSAMTGRLGHGHKPSTDWLGITKRIARRR